jgi:hypothetical protein
MLNTRKLLILLALALLPGCAPPSQARGSAASAATGTDAVTIEVSNDLLSEAKVYLARSVVRRELGSVPAGRTGRFTVPARAICGFDVRLSIATLDGTASYASEEFTVWPGDALAFKLTGGGALRGR